VLFHVTPLGTPDFDRCYGDFVAIPTVLTVSHSVRMGFYTCRPSDIRLEEFTRSVPMAAAQETLLQRRIIKRSDYWRVALAMLPAPDASTYILQIMCYDPHHRIVLTNRDGTVHEVEICFRCRKMCVDSDGLGGTPLVWQYTLLSLFQHYGMPERSPAEYSELQRAAPNQTMQPTAGRSVTSL